MKTLIIVGNLQTYPTAKQARMMSYHIPMDGCYVWDDGVFLLTWDEVEANEHLYQGVRTIIFSDEIIIAIVFNKMSTLRSDYDRAMGVISK